MIKYRITKTRSEWFYLERKQNIFHSWAYVSHRQNYDDAVLDLKEQQRLDDEGLPKVVWRNWNV